VPPKKPDPAKPAPAKPLAKPLAKPAKRRPRRPTAVPAVRCAAKSKRSGQRCKNFAVPGAKVCVTHGGNAAQVRKAAERRVQQIVLRAEAAKDLRRLGVTLDTTPIEILEAMYSEAAGNVAVLRSMVAELDRTDLYSELYHENGSPTGRALPHVLVVMYNTERDRLAKLAEACAKLGLDERRLQLAEAQMVKLLDAVTGALADVGLTAAVVARFKQALAQRLRSAP
jgi:hypothetical protein